MKNVFRDVKGTAESATAGQDGQVVPNFRSSWTGYHRMDIRAEEITPDSRAKWFSPLPVNTQRDPGGIVNSLKSPNFSSL